ncbi:MAG: hypothetical protein Q4B16_04545 [Bacteroidia bacterium]|nr:hypothetical protein [Bacteroidia bacterium]
MHTNSKGYRRFKSRVEYFQEDMETVAVLLKNKELLADSDKIFQSVTERGQPRLSKRQSTSGSRDVVVRHLQNTLFVSVIKDLYEEVILYCAYASDCAAQTSPNANRLIGAQNCSFNANDLLSLPDRKSIISLIMSRVFRSIENKKDTLLLVSALNERLNLGVSPDTISNALPYLEARHKFIHSDGKADDKFSTDHPEIALDKDGYIILNSTIIQKALSAIKKLVTEYESAMKANNLFPQEEFE